MSSASEIRFSTRFTSADLKASRKFAGLETSMVGTRALLILSGPFLFLFVSILLFNPVAIGVGAFLVVFFAWISFRYASFGQKAKLQLDRQFRFGPDLAEQRFSQTQVQVSLRAYDQIKETEQYFLFKRHAVGHAIRKSSMSVESQSALSQWIEESRDWVGDEVVSKERLLGLAVPLTAELFNPATLRSDVYSWEWTEEDVDRLASSQLRAYHPEQPGLNKPPKRFWLYFYPIVFVLLMAYLYFQSDEPFLLFALAPVAGGVGVYFYLWAINKVVRWWLRRALAKVDDARPKLPAKVALTERGIVISDGASAVCFGWGDISQFYLGPMNLGFLGADHALQALPRRIFNGQALPWLALAQKLKNQSIPTAEMADNAEVIESGNPYQAPSHE